MDYKGFTDYQQSELNGPNRDKYLGYNNKYSSFPAMMNDGRLMKASWQPHSEDNVRLLQSNNIKSNWQYRQYLIKNANEIMDFNANEANKEMGNRTDLNLFKSNEVDYEHKNPYMYSSVLDKSMPFGTTSSDLKTIYLTREELESRKVAPSINQEDLLNFKR